MTVDDGTSNGVHHRLLPLDGVRGCAILLVLLFHLPLSNRPEFGYANPLLVLARFGWCGVDLFFVLSGFLITGILYDSKSQSGYYRNFYGRRALRVFPLYYLVFTCVMLINAVWPALGFVGSAHPIWILTYLSNFKLAFSGENSLGVLRHTWSLAVEEHYYLIWPTIVLLLNRKQLMIVTGIAAVIAFIVRCSFVEDGTMSVAGYVLTYARMDSLAAGSFIALAARGRRGLGALKIPAFWLLPISLLIIAAIIFVRRTVSMSDPVMGTAGITTLWVGFSALLVLALTWKPLEALMALPVLRWFGKYSYGLYFWHPIVFAIFWAQGISRLFPGKAGSNLHFITVDLLALTVTLLVAFFSWQLWEKQFLKLKRFFSYRTDADRPLAEPAQLKLNEAGS